MSLIKSVSGIRGVVGETLTPEVIVKYVSAFAEYKEKIKILIGRDGRITGNIIGNLVSATLCSRGCKVIDLGIVPTPTVQLAIEDCIADGGISITASHNPIEWNGLKFMNCEGMFLDSEENQEFFSVADNLMRKYKRWNQSGRYFVNDTFIDKHIEKVIELSYLQSSNIYRRNFKIVVDCINAAGGYIVPELLRRFGCEVITMNCDMSGIFAHTPEPIPENLTQLCQRVREEQADLGIAVDPDVDRLVLVNEKGEPFIEEYTIASVVDFVLNEEKKIKPNDKQKVVVNLSTTRAVDDVARKYSAEIFRSPVGEINVAKKMKEVGAIVGGEGSGGVILTEAHLGRDAIVGIGLILQHLANFGGTLSELKATMPQYFISKDKMLLDGTDVSKIFNRLKERFAKDGRVNTEDGLKIDFADSWVHLRTSNTEPIVRIIAEAPTVQEAQNLVQQFKQEIQKLL